MSVFIFLNTQKSFLQSYGNFSWYHCKAEFKRWILSELWPLLSKYSVFSHQVVALQWIPFMQSAWLLTLCSGLIIKVSGNVGSWQGYLTKSFWPFWTQKLPFLVILSNLWVFFLLFLAILGKFISCLYFWGNFYHMGTHKSPF